MAIAKGNITRDAESPKLYVGVGTVRVLAINPTMKQLNEIYNRDSVTEEPVYTSTIKINDQDVSTVRIDFICKTDTDKHDGVEKIARMSFTLRNQIRSNKDNTKIQVVDEYGRFAWVTEEEYKTHAIPTYKNGPANITANYRAAYPGEEDLTNALRTYLNIPNVMYYNNNEWKMVEHPEECEVRLEHIDDYFKGDFKELQEALTFQPLNKIKVVFGVRTTEDNKQYQTLYTKSVLKCTTTNYSKVMNEIMTAQESASLDSALKNTEFFKDGVLMDLSEYVNTPTKIEVPQAPQTAPASWLTR